MLVLLAGLLPVQAAFADTAEQTEPANLKAAKAAYGIETVYNCADYEDIEDALLAAQGTATAADPVIVYAGSGNYTITAKQVYKDAGAVSGIYIPENIVLVGEADSVIIDKTTNDTKPLMILGGSVYGFCVKCGLTSDTVIKYKNGVSYSTAKAPSGKQINGNTEKVQIIAPGLTGIQAITATNININNNIVRDGRTRNTTGISLLYGAKANSISGNKIYNLGSSAYGSAISLCHSDAVAIDRNVIRNVAGHGISTDSEQSGKGHAYCLIKYVRKNSISGAKDGIWLENKCQITGDLSNNTIMNCTVNGIGIQALSKYKDTKSGSIRKMEANTIKNTTRSNMSIYGKYAVVRMTKGNVISGCKKTNNVTIDKGAKLYISGNYNKIINAKGFGVYVNNKSYLSINGKNNLKNNSKYGVGIVGKSKCVIKSSNLKGNKKGSARVGKGSSFKYSKCKMGKVVKAKTVR